MLDKKDKIIIANLMVDCKITTTKLSKLTKLSQPSIIYRIRRLENEKYILRYDTLINHNKFKLNCDNIIITVPQNKQEEFEKQCKNNKGIMSVFRTIHKYNYIITTFGTLKEIQEFINYLKKSNFKFEHFPNSESYCPVTSIYDVNVNYKEPHYIDKVLDIDEIDAKILEVVSHSGAKLSMLELSKKINVTVDIALYRYKRLKQHKYFLLNLAQVNLKKFHLNYNFLLLKTKNIEFDKIKKKLFKLKRIVWFGKVDENTYFMTLISKDYEDYTNLLNRIYNELDDKIVSFEIFLVKGWQFLNRINFKKTIIKK